MLFITLHICVLQSLRTVMSASPSSIRCGETFVAESGVIKSPGYPAKYPPNQYCVYKILGSADSLLWLTCTKQSIPDSRGCFKDYLEIKCRKYCGKERPTDIYGTGQLTLIFHSDKSKSKKGFVCNYKRLSGGPYVSTPPPTTPPYEGSVCIAEGSTYNYDEVLHKSLLFYEAQRSGYLPDSQRVTWRKDSATDDAVDDETGEHVDLEGGYYDAADRVKFGFPLASMATKLAWGGIEYRTAYTDSGEMPYLEEALRWAIDYLIKAHTEPNVLYVQVGQASVDHANKYCGPPENMTMYRPAYKITPDKPGSDVASETAAAFASASILFKDSDPTYAATCLKHAEELFNFAITYRGLYSEVMPDEGKFYKSWGDEDELGWAAAWLYRATGSRSYLNEAENQYPSMPQDILEFSWDQKTPGFLALMAEYADESSRTTYANDLQRFCDKMVDKTDRTPLGLIFIDPWSSLAPASNAALVCLRAADLGISTEKYREFGKQQIHYMLGDGGRSYMVGFGQNFPIRALHLSISCVDYCDDYPNVIEVTGGLVGGPGPVDDFEDCRCDFKKNEVSIDYNSGFQSAVASLRTLASCVNANTSSSPIKWAKNHGFRVKPRGRKPRPSRPSKTTLKSSLSKKNMPPTSCENLVVLLSNDNSSWKATVNIPIETDVSAWTVEFVFTAPLITFKQWIGTTKALSNVSYLVSGEDSNTSAGTTLSFDMLCRQVVRSYRIDTHGLKELQRSLKSSRLN